MIQSRFLAKIFLPSLISWCLINSNITQYLEMAIIFYPMGQIDRTKKVHILQPIHREQLLDMKSR